MTSYLNTATELRGSAVSNVEIKAVADTVLRRQHFLDRLFRVTTQFFAFLVLVVLVGIVISLMLGAWPALKAFGIKFLFNAAWDPVKGDFGAWVPIVGTLVTSGIAMLIGIPVSFGIALFLTELSPA